MDGAQTTPDREVERLELLDERLAQLLKVGAAVRVDIGARLKGRKKTLAQPQAKIH